jgi:hypothetical protein
VAPIKQRFYWICSDNVCEMGAFMHDLLSYRHLHKSSTFLGLAAETILETNVTGKSKSGLEPFDVRVSSEDVVPNDLAPSRPQRRATAFMLVSSRRAGCGSETDSPVGTLEARDLIECWPFY